MHFIGLHFPLVALMTPYYSLWELLSFGMNMNMPKNPLTSFTVKDVVRSVSACGQHTVNVHTF